MSSIEELYLKYNYDILHFMVNLGVKKEQAEDLVQEVYMRIMITKSSFEGKSSEKTWLYSIARNIVVDYYRKQKNFGIYDDFLSLQVKDDGALPEEIALQKEEVYSIFHSLQFCTIDQKRVIMLRYINEMSIIETAKFLGWSESKVKITQHRALKVLRIKLFCITRINFIEEGNIRYFINNNKKFK